MHITHVHPQVDYYHRAQTMPYRYISSRVDAIIPQFFTQETTQLSYQTKPTPKVRSSILQVVASVLPLA